MKQEFFNIMQEFYLQKKRNMGLQLLKKNEERINELFSHYHQEKVGHYNLHKLPIILNISESKGNNSEFTTVSPNHSMLKEPEKVIGLLSPYIYSQNHKEALKQLINGEKINTKIDIECQANKLIYFFKELFEADKATFLTKKNLGK